MDLKYRRILIKLSGEVLMGQEPHGFCTQTTRRIAQEIAHVVQAGVEVAIVIGGGNIFRGTMGRGLGISASASDTMGMLATMINGVMFRDVLEDAGIPVALFSSVFMPSVCTVYNRSCALEHLRRKEICLFVAGTGHPYFTTDTASVLRARETECDAVFKATKVPGVFSADPCIEPHAVHYPVLSYDDVLTRRLHVMDMTALTMAQEGDMPLVVFSILEPGGLMKALQGQGLFSVIQRKVEKRHGS